MQSIISLRSNITRRKANIAVLHSSRKCDTNPGFLLVPYEGSLFFNEETFQSFPEELQQIILEVGREITAKSRTVVAEEEAKTLAEMEDMGVTIIRPDLTEFRAATKHMYDENTAITPVIDLINKAR